ncbi:putative brix [Lyophyllum shimeji]|uniref:Ribosome production factor 2 homolog n=1 Tax=Lyophyllum shimeji TaxID=47721 RepID=A0A9P3PPV0_LYOSH|nr:putative brix [Lyophyllum shimeji]
MRLLPLGLALLCQITVFRGIAVLASRQCHLKAPGKALAGVPGDRPSDPSGSIGAPQSTGSRASSTSRSSAASTPTATQSAAFDYSSQKIRGVNLGGWLVLEPWITPSVFESTNNDAIVDEYTMGQLLDSQTAQKILKQHWETWITEDDFAAIKAAGLNHVRIPLGYWLPERLRQFGAAHFESCMGVEPCEYVIELLNEPAGFRGDDWAQTIRQFWLDGYDAVRKAAGNGIKVMIGDAFLGVQNWSGFLNYPRGQGVIMDFHEYQIFSDPELDRSFDEHLAFACTYSDNLSAYQGSNIWTIIGEWSNAVTDCARWLNGRGVGARWDATWFPPNSRYHGSCTNFTGSYSGFPSAYKTFLRKYWEVQVEIGEHVSGWVFWTWKAENADEWSYQKGLEGGWIPQDPTDRKYPGIFETNERQDNPNWTSYIMLRTIKPKNARSKRALEARLPKEVEDARTSIFVKGTHTGETLNCVMRDLMALKRPNAISFSKKNPIHPFDSTSTSIQSLEFWAGKNDASMFLVGQTTKKRPNGLTFVRMYNSQVLDMMEVGVDSWAGMDSFKTRKSTPGHKPMMHFASELFDTHPRYIQVKSMLMDFFNGEVVDSICLPGLEHVISVTCAPTPASLNNASASTNTNPSASEDVSSLPKIHIRTYTTRLLSSGTRIPRVELEPMGPSLDLSLRRHQPADPELWKQAMKRPKLKKADIESGLGKKRKNLQVDEMGDLRGQVHIAKQDLSKLQTRKMKGLKGGALDTDQDGQDPQGEEGTPRKRRKTDTQ